MPIVISYQVFLFNTNKNRPQLYDIKYSCLIQIIRTLGYGFYVFLRNTNNLSTIFWFQVITSYTPVETTFQELTWKTSAGYRRTNHKIISNQLDIKLGQFTRENLDSVYNNQK